MMYLPDTINLPGIHTKAIFLTIAMTVTLNIEGITTGTPQPRPYRVKVLTLTYLSGQEKYKGLQQGMGDSWL